ncbi:DUF934 domain-containing protein [Planktotalea sp.]|uniref:DUF934 domain-containing protein n=1 Tax=Planktotalea sp. TaxID=2029877 RepID=UPI0025CC6017|nr:DUF934 domain-containing protein [Planktotalea sp.]
MSTVVTDKGFTIDDWNAGYEGADTLDLASDADLVSLDFNGIVMIRVDFPSFADGRGFTIARQLRLRGYTGRLRAKGHVIADQYAMARRAGFDEVEIDASLAQRQPEPDWLARSNWQAGDYQARLRG